MSRPLGSRQLAWLKNLASPHRFLIVGNKVSQSLARRGLLAPRSPDGTAFFQITPAGLRTLADEWDAGRIEFPLPKPKKAESGDAQKPT